MLFSNMKFVRAALGAIIPVALMLAFTSCTRKAGDRQRGGSAETSAPYVKAIYSLPLTFDPAQMNDSASLTVSNLIYDGLLSFSETLEIRNELAESWSTSGDGRKLHFHLRPNAKFHDGTPITSQDVQASFERLIAKNSKVYTFYDCIEGAEEYHSGRAHRLRGIRLVNAHEFEIRLKEPYPPFVSILAGATAKILPKAARDADFFRRPVGSGAFRIESISKDSIVLSAHERYAGKPAKIRRLVLRALDEREAIKEAAAASVADSVTGAIHDLASYPLSGNESVFAAGKHLTAPLAATWIIGLNIRRAPFDNLSVRRKFQQDFDVEKFRLSFQPDSLPAYGYIPTGLAGNLTQPTRQQPVRASTPTRQITVAIPAVLARAPEMKVFIEESMRAKGWNIRAELLEWDEMMRRYAAKSMQAFLVSMNMDYPETEFLVKNFESTSSDNFSGVRDGAIDRLIRAARATQDRVKRQQLFAQIARRVNELAVSVNLLHPRQHVWTSDCVSGLSLNLLSEVYIDYRNVALAGNCVKQRAEQKMVRR